MPRPFLPLKMASFPLHTSFQKNIKFHEICSGCTSSRRSTQKHRHTQPSMKCHNTMKRHFSSCLTYVCSMLEGVQSIKICDLLHSPLSSVLLLFSSLAMFCPCRSFKCLVVILHPILEESNSIFFIFKNDSTSSNFVIPHYVSGYNRPRTYNTDSINP